MKKYIEPAIEVVDMELTNCVMQMSGGNLSKQGDFTEGQSILESRQRGSEWSEYEGQ
jgi:hypothetical protein